MSGSEAHAAEQSHEGPNPAQTGRQARAVDSVLGRLAAAHRVCRDVASAASLEGGLRDVAESFRDIFAAGLVVVDWFDPGEPARGSSPADAEVASWWAPWQSRVDEAAGGPATVFTVPVAERVGALADVQRLIVIELASDGRHGAVGIGYPDDRRCSEEELTALAILGEHLALTLAHGRTPAARPDRASSTRSRGTDELVAIAAHELRTPLTPITMLLQSLERKAKSGAVDIEAIARTRRQVHRLTKMISDLLDLSRLRRDRLALDPQPVALASAIADAVRLFGEGEQKNEIDTVLPEEPLHVVFDRHRLQQSLAAWLEHVARVSPVGAPIHVKLERGGRFVSLTITGPRNGGLEPARAAAREPVKAASLSLAVHLSDELTAHYGGGLAIEGACGEQVTARLPLHEMTGE